MEPAELLDRSGLEGPLRGHGWAGRRFRGRSRPGLSHACPLLRSAEARHGASRYASAIKADGDVQLVADMEMGDLLDRCGRGGEARKCYGDIAKAAGSAKAHYNFGVALMDRGRTDEAMVHFRKALEIKPKFADAHYKLGVALVGRGRPEEAVAHYQQALNLKPDYAEAHINLGIALAGRGRMDEAMAHFQKALEVEPGYAAAHVHVGVALAGCGRMDEAMAHFQKALEIDPDSAAAHLNLGTAWRARRGTRSDRPFPTGPGNQARLRRGP